MADVTAELNVRLLGEPSVMVGGKSVDALASPRLLSLLALLVVNRSTPMTRQRIAFTLWPNSPEAQARTNLRQALHLLKRALPDVDRHLDADGPLLRWRPDSPATVDLVEVDDAARAAESGDPAALARAAEGYGGDLLPAAPDEWLGPIRDRLRQEHVGRLEQLSERAEEEDGDIAASIRWSQRLLLADPYHEPTYRRLMRLYGPADRARSVRTFHACTTRLDRDLGLAPSPETVALYERIVATPAPIAGDSVPLRPSRLVGRRAERARLVDAVRRAASGTSVVVLVHGEPGIGKSSLVADVMAWCWRQSMATVTTRAYEAEGRLALAPIVDLLRSPAMAGAYGRLEEPWLDELVRLVPDVVARMIASPAVARTDVGERARLFAAVAMAIRVLGHPLVVALDDLQWCDAETLELLHFIVRTCASVPLAVLATARDEGLDDGSLATLISGLRSLDALVDVPLGGLDHVDASELVATTLGGAPPAAVLGRVVDAAAGNPLFLVEMARADVDPSTGELVLPERVQAVIERRLAGLSAHGRTLAEVMAVIGRQADLGLVGRLWPTSSSDLADALDELWRRHILVEVGADSYDFTHDRIRDVAYAGVGPARRRALHRQVAEALEVQRATGLDEVAATIAVHHERAGNVARAIEHYELAIAAAGRVFAHHEVIALAQRALELLGRLPDGRERTARELSILGPLAVATYEGPGVTPETRYVFDRIAELRAESERPLDPTVLRLTANAAIGFRRFEEPGRIGAELLDRGASDPLLLTEGHYLCGVGSFWLGHLDRSAEHLERSLCAYDEDRRDVHIQRFGQDPRSVCLIRLALTYGRLGRLDEAPRLRREALAEALATGHPYTIQYVVAFAMWAVHDAEAYDELDELVARHPPTHNSFVRFNHDAFAAVAAARHQPGTAALERLLAIADEARREQPVIEPQALVLAATVSRCDRPEAGLDAARRARVIAAREMPILLTDAWWAEAQLLHVLGAAGADIRRALDETIAVARCQGAVTAERRAAQARSAWHLA
jgi:DNA-binding SARP family transcriptional activator